MKIKKLWLKNYKGFTESKLISFCDKEGKVNEITLLVGNNGTGKSSILQAIASVLGSVVRPDMKRKPSMLNWPGYDYKLMAGFKSSNPQASLTMAMSADELNATNEYEDRLRTSRSLRNKGLPYAQHEFDLKLNYAEDKAEVNTPAEIEQLGGYQTALKMRSEKIGGMELFDRVGTILWYTEQRTSTSLFSGLARTNKNNDFPFEKLQGTLVNWYNFHRDKKINNWNLLPGQRDLYEKLSGNYQKIFPNRSFHGVVPRMDPNEIYHEPDFYLNHGDNKYALSEMSAGERAVFPILLDFANWNVNNSIIIIDEIELHLHPPLQQALIRMLPILGENNQFIITTHSDDVASMFSESQIKRAPLWQ